MVYVLVHRLPITITMTFCHIKFIYTAATVSEKEKLLITLSDFEVQ